MIKFIAAFLVVFIHTPGTNEIFSLKIISRSAVPIFFMITGFYYQSLAAKGTFWRHYRKILGMTLTCFAFYAGYSLFFDVWAGRPLASALTGKALLRLLCLNTSPYGLHLWYLFALLYALPMVHWAKRHIGQRFLWAIGVLLFLVAYFGVLTPRVEYFRNFLFFAFPMLLTGDALRTFLKSRQWSQVGVWVAFITSLILLLSEGYLYRFCQWHPYRELFFFSVPFAACTMLLAYGNPAFGRETKVAFWGKKYSPYIYIWHVMVSGMTGTVLYKLGIQITDPFLLTLLYFILTLVLVIGYFGVFGAIKRRRSAASRRVVP